MVRQKVKQYKIEATPMVITWYKAISSATSTTRRHRSRPAAILKARDDSISWKFPSIITKELYRGPRGIWGCVCRDICVKRQRTARNWGREAECTVMGKLIVSGYRRTDLHSLVGWGPTVPVSYRWQLSVLELADNHSGIWLSQLFLQYSFQTFGSSNPVSHFAPRHQHTMEYLQHTHTILYFHFCMHYLVGLRIKSSDLEWSKEKGVSLHLISWTQAPLQRGKRGLG